MTMKIFGRQLFEQKPKVMYDFAKHGLMDNDYPIAITDLIRVESEADLRPAKPKKRVKIKKTPELSPKEIYKMASLNDNNFAIKIDPKYLKEQIDESKHKLSLVMQNKSSEEKYGSSHFAKEELQSIIERLKNRKKINFVGDVLEKYPHTTSDLMRTVLKNNGNLRCKEYTEFIPDLPSEALAAVVEYNKMCSRLCGKDTHFYIIADKKDFGEVNKRRDPILLAQSPFGFFWQILGAWDEEMIYLGDL